MSPPGFDPSSDDDDASGAPAPTDSTDPTRAERPLAAVRDAAVERALVDEDGAARNLALAGRLERARRAAADGDDLRRSDLFAPVLVAVATLAAFDADGSAPAGPPASPPDTAAAWNPTVAAADDAPADPVVEGAAIAVRRFDADLRRAAALADVPVATLRHRVGDVSGRE